MSINQAGRRQLRHALRSRRNQLAPTARRSATRDALRRLQRLSEFRRAHRIGLYHAHRGELDPAALVALEHQRFYVPVLRGKALRFAPLGHARGGRNRFGIAEPLATRSLRPAALDLVITPLVGFDEYGTRLGAGGGFYDRSFALRNRGRNRPLSVGLAFACQQVEALSCQPWDVPLDCIVTERGVIRPLQSPRREAATQE